MYSTTQIRDRLHEWAMKNQLNKVFGDDRYRCRNFLHRCDGGFKKLPMDREFFYFYNFYYLMAQEIMLKRYWKTLDKERCEEDVEYCQQQRDRISMLRKIMFADMTGAACPIAAIAWFTIDNWRWPDEDLQGLSYGLVLQYPELLTFGAYLTGLGDRKLLEKELTESEIERLRGWARDGVDNWFEQNAGQPLFEEQSKPEPSKRPSCSNGVDFEDLIP